MFLDCIKDCIVTYYLFEFYNSNILIQLIAAVEKNIMIQISTLWQNRVSEYFLIFIYISELFNMCVIVCTITISNSHQPSSQFEYNET